MGVRTPPRPPLAYNLRNKRATMSQNMVFLNKKKYKKNFLGGGTDPSPSGGPTPFSTSTPPILKSWVRH